MVAEDGEAAQSEAVHSTRHLHIGEHEVDVSFGNAHILGAIAVFGFRRLEAESAQMFV
ncbi:MAG TPA: hypothetical protein VHC73_07685 [Vitreimonas sp.]|jgi:hypothetical protein|nr:hypothetical protein [Vitreimonas sp.]